MNAARNYNHRVKAFINEIVLDKNNPMAVKHYSTKVEFQGRGAGHNHGTLWVDLKKMEYYIQDENGDCCALDDILKNGNNPFIGGKTKEEIKIDIIEALNTKYGMNKEKKLTKEQEDSIKLFYKYFIQTDRKKELENPDEFLSTFPLYGIQSAFKKFQTNEELLKHEELAIINFVNRFTTCTLNKDMIASKTSDPHLKERSSEVADICTCVNVHNHTKTCVKYDTTCRFKFGKFPVWETLIAKPSRLSLSERQQLTVKYKKILKDVREILDNNELIQSILNEYPDKHLENKDTYKKNREERIRKVLKMAGLKTIEDMELYVQALSTSSGGYSIVMERDLDEMFVNSYNPEWARAWNGNHDIQVCLDYFAVITYITEYYTKDDSGTMTLLLKALKETECETLKEKMVTLMNTYISARQMGEVEALYKIFPDFHLKDSNVSTVFVPVSRKADRSKFLMKIDEDINYNGKEKFKIDGRDGFYVEKYDIVSKYERSKQYLEETSFSQFSKMYTPGWKKEKKNKGLEENEDRRKQDNNEKDKENENKNKDKEKSHGWTEKTKFDFVMKCISDTEDPNHLTCKTNQTKRLPDEIPLSFVYPGEPPMMRKRKFPAVLRFHKFKVNTHPKEYFFSEALLYKPFQNEEELEIENERLNENNCKQLSNKITCVKQQVMEYLEDVDEARHFVGETARNEEVENLLDPETIKDIEDCEYEGIVNHPDYPEFDFDILETDVKGKKFEKTYRTIEVDNIEVLLEKTRQLDYFKKKVEIGIRYARNLVKSLKLKNSIPTPPWLTVLGGAGSGKSADINVLKQWVHIILQSPGDNPDCPYLIVTGPTGTAAANVRGQTLHTAFGFSFGNEHYSLSDKKRDEKRTLLKNLRAVIIDEISMVKSDLLYQLDMRLREVTQKPDKIFGGVAIFDFGDILQLRPCRARYIFEEPVCQDYKISFHCGTHWNAFNVINLEENHRQNEDKDYADLLNRVRVGQQTPDDIKLLETRVRTLGHPDLKGAMYLSCTNVEVNKLNVRGLNEIDSTLETVEAINIHPTIKNFKPHINSHGNIGTERNPTPFKQTLSLKIGARIMLTYNIDVLDCLTNGARGELVAFQLSKLGYIEKIIIRFDDVCQGEQKRKCDNKTEENYPGCTIIERVMFQYSLGRKTTSASNTAKLIQFPLCLCFATTAHKFQGQTVLKPLKIVVDLRTVFAAAMAYVMLSRVQAISQLFILESVPVSKFYADQRALNELERLINKSMNKNPSSWEKNDDTSIKILSLNCQSLKHKIPHIRDDLLLIKSDVICLSETWLLSDEVTEDLQINGYKLDLNSIGHGKGLATYIKANKLMQSDNIKEETFQLTKLTSPSVDVISVYRSKKSSQAIAKHLLKLIDLEKITVICGDFNICFKDDRQNWLIKFLEELGFQQLNREATHIAGGHIDHVYVNKQADVDVSLYSPYYCAKDHDALLMVVKLELNTNLILDQL